MKKTFYFGGCSWVLILIVFSIGLANIHIRAAQVHLPNTSIPTPQDMESKFYADTLTSTMLPRQYDVPFYQSAQTLRILPENPNVLNLNDLETVISNGTPVVVGSGKVISSKFFNLSVLPTYSQYALGLDTICIIADTVSVELATDIFTYMSYPKPTFLDIDPNKTNYPVEAYYAAYIQYAFSSEDPTPILSFREYTEYGDSWKQKIPEHFVYAMLNESIIQNVPMEYIYAISRHETITYRFFKSLKVNTNGSTDYGLMGLNDQNFDTSTASGRFFLDLFYYYDNPSEEFDHTNQLHILKTCVRYFKSLHRDTGTYWGACMAYNGGISRVLRGNPKPAVIAYATKVFEIRNTVSHLRLNATDKPKNTDITFRIIRYSKKKFFTFANQNRFVRILDMESTSVYAIKTYFTVAEIHNIIIALWYSLEFLTVQPVEIVISGGEYLGYLSQSGNYIILG
jgi:hypothetical protein